MTVWDIVQQFTHMHFNLIVLDVESDEEYYDGIAQYVEDDPAGNFLVAAMEPPLHANEVILYVDIDAVLDSDAADIVIEDRETAYDRF